MNIDELRRDAIDFRCFALVLRVRILIGFAASVCQQRVRQDWCAQTGRSKQTRAAKSQLIGAARETRDAHQSQAGAARASVNFSRTDPVHDDDRVWPL